MTTDLQSLVVAWPTPNGCIEIDPPATKPIPAKSTTDVVQLAEAIALAGRVHEYNDAVERRDWKTVDELEQVHGAFRGDSVWSTYRVELTLGSAFLTAQELTPTAVKAITSEIYGPFGSVLGSVLKSRVKRHDDLFESPRHIGCVMQRHSPTLPTPPSPNLRIRDDALKYPTHVSALRMSGRLLDFHGSALVQGVASSTIRSFFVAEGEQRLVWCLYQSTNPLDLRTVAGTTELSDKWLVLARQHLSPILKLCGFVETSTPDAWCPPRSGSTIFVFSWGEDDRATRLATNHARRLALEHDTINHVSTHCVSFASDPTPSSSSSWFATTVRHHITSTGLDVEDSYFETVLLPQQSHMTPVAVVSCYVIEPFVERVRDIVGPDTLPSPALLTFLREHAPCTGLGSVLPRVEPTFLTCYGIVQWVHEYLEGLSQSRPIPDWLAGMRAGDIRETSHKTSNFTAKAVPSAGLSRQTFNMSAKAVLAVEDVARELLKPTPGVTILYHATRLEHANSVMFAPAFGMKSDSDFGPSLYTTTFARQAIGWAMGRTGEGPPAIVAWAIPVEDLDGLNVKDFPLDTTSDEFKRVVWSWRALSVGEERDRWVSDWQDAEYDLVRGPVATTHPRGSPWAMDNIRRLRLNRYGETPAMWGDQVAFQTTRALRVLRKSARCVIVVHTDVETSDEAGAGAGTGSSDDADVLGDASPKWTTVGPDGRPLRK